MPIVGRPWPRWGWTRSTPRSARSSFFDTPDLTLNQHGVVVRVRRVQGKPADSVIKLRPVVPDELPSASAEVAELRRRGRRHARWLRVLRDDEGRARSDDGEGDPGRAPPAAQAVQPGAAGPLREHTLRTGSPSTTLAMLGPINVLKLKFTPADFGRRLVAELWFYPDGSRILELSTKCAPRRGLRGGRRDQGVPRRSGIDLNAEQQTKTKTALRFFAKELHGTGTAGDERGGIHHEPARTVRASRACRPRGTTDRQVQPATATGRGAAVPRPERRQLPGCTGEDVPPRADRAGRSGTIAGDRAPAHADPSRRQGGAS